MLITITYFFNQPYPQIKINTSFPVLENFVLELETWVPTAAR